MLGLNGWIQVNARHRNRAHFSHVVALIGEIAMMALRKIFMGIPD